MSGVLVRLAAVALSVKPGGMIGAAHFGGDVTARGDNVTTIEVEGDIDQLIVDGTVRASGAGAVGLRLTAAQLDPSTLRIDAPRGTTVVSGGK